MSGIPFYKPSVPVEDALDHLRQALQNGWLTTGPLTAEFSKKLQDYLETPTLIPVSSCTAALSMALKLAGIKDGDEVIIPSNTFIATLEVIVHAGAIPVLVDIERDSFNMDLDQVIPKITKKTKAIIAVPFAGQPLQMDRLRSLCDDHSIKCILDLAHAFESKYQDKFLWHYADYSCYSFYATKNLTTGEGGALIVTDAAEFERAQSLTLHGLNRDAWKRYQGGPWAYDIEEFGFKYNFPDLLSAVGLAQISSIEEKLKRRHALHQIYLQVFAEFSFIQFQKINFYESSSRSAAHLMIGWLDPSGPLNRDQFMDILKRSNIGYSLHFTPLYRFKAVREKFGFSINDFPVNEEYFAGCISLPFYPDMARADIELVAKTAKAAV
jgi:perosamine synthetase